MSAQSLQLQVEEARQKVELLQTRLNMLSKAEQAHAALKSQLQPILDKFRELAGTLQARDQVLASSVQAIADVQQQPDFPPEQMAILCRVLKALEKGSDFDTRTAQFLLLQQRKEELRKIVAEKEELVRQEAALLALERNNLKHANRNSTALAAVVVEAAEVNTS